MDVSTAVTNLSGARPRRAALAIFRLLVKAGPDFGMAAGDIARKLDTAPNTLRRRSLLGSCRMRGFIGARRAGRSIIYCRGFRPHERAAGFP